MTGHSTQKSVIGLIMILVIMGSGLAAFAETITYAYDPMGRVTRAESDAAAVSVYAYDTMGNRVTKTTTGSPLEVGVVAAYPFSEGSGATTADVSGHGHDGTLQGATWTTDGKVGHALSFDGVDDYVEISYDQSLDISNTSFSIAVWVKPVQNGDQVYIGIHASYTSQQSLHVRIYDDGRVRLGFYGDDLDTGSGAVSFGQWNHIVCTYHSANDTSKIFVNGVEQASGNQGPFVGSSPTMYIGKWSETAPQFFNGTIDEVRFYNRALSAQDILALYNSSGLVASYPFSEGSGTTTGDASGNGYDGTLLNGVSWTTNGKVGNALSFDGVDDYVEIADAPDLDFESEDFSVTFWVKKLEASVGSENCWGVNKWNTGASPGTNEWSISLTTSGNDDKPGFFVESGLTKYKATSPDDISLNQWHHLAGVRQGQQLLLYVDGVLKAEEIIGVVSINNVGRNVRIANGQANGFFTKALFDEVRIYNKALTASEVQDLAGVGGSATFAVTSFSKRSAPLSVGVAPLVEVDGASVYINVGESPDLNYGIGDFTVMVTARTADASSVHDGTPPWPPSRGESTPQPSSNGENTPLPPSRGEYTSLPPSRGDFMGSVSHVAVGVRQGTDLFLYLDGALQAQKKVGDGRITRLKVNVGLDDVSTHAIIEDVKLSPYALSPEEIAGYSGQ